MNASGFPERVGSADPGQARAWLMAARPKTLPAAAAPVIVGTALAWSHGAFAALPAAAALLGALLIQVGTNFANDYYDFVKGADTAERKGPTRVTQAGLIAPATVKRAMIATFGLAVLTGLYLVWVGGWPIVVIGVLSVASGVAYTGGPYPLGYHGLGDAFVLVFFGPVAVAGTYFVQALAWSGTAVAVGLAVGAIATAILAVNNVRDVDTDAPAGKRTLPVRFGERAGRFEYAALTSGAYALPGTLVATGALPVSALLVGLSLPFAVKLVREAMTVTDAVAFNALLAKTGAHLAVFSALLAVGIVIA